jgi:hypothetical protein
MADKEAIAKQGWENGGGQEISCGLVRGPRLDRETQETQAIFGSISWKWAIPDHDSFLQIPCI